MTDNEVFQFCSAARISGYAIAVFVPDELGGLDPYEVSDILVSAGNEYISEYAVDTADESVVH